MAWIDDRVWCHRKLVDISDRSFRVWIHGLAYSAGHLTGGRLTAGQQKLIGSTPKTKQNLVETGLWETDAADVTISGWDEHNGKRDKRREMDRERKKLARLSAGTSAGQSSGRSAGRERGGAAGTARVEGSEGSEGSEGNPSAVQASPSFDTEQHQDFTIPDLREIA